MLNRRPALTATVCVVVLVAASGSLTRFRSAADVLSESSWGAETPTSTWIASFATLRPWWYRTLPEAVQVTPTFGIVPVVEVPRSEVRSRENRPVLPDRGIGYYAVLGAVTAVRSGISDSLVFDFVLFVRLQQLLLVLSMSLCPLVLFLAFERRSRPALLGIYTTIYLVLLLVRPNKDIFLAEGIIDSAFASPLALMAIPAFAAIVAAVRRQSRARLTLGALASLFLGYCSMVRGEFLVVFVIAFAFLAAATIKRERRAWLLAVSLSLMLAVPFVYGVINLALFEHFVPLRMQTGQNLLEPIGQFPNPYGIEYSDAWVEAYLKANGIEYVSFEADRFLTARYVEILMYDPGLLLMNFVRRLNGARFDVSLFINAWTLIPVIGLSIVACRRNREFLYGAIPLAIAIGFLVFCGWFNNLPRVIAPAHFLTNVVICVLVVWLADRTIQKRISGRPANA